MSRYVVLVTINTHIAKHKIKHPYLNIFNSECNCIRNNTLKYDT